MPSSRRTVMRQYSLQISMATVSGRYALMVMDAAGMHTNDITEDFENLSIVK